jgi:hypothetical protein
MIPLGSTWVYFNRVNPTMFTDPKVNKTDSGIKDACGQKLAGQKFYAEQLQAKNTSCAIM